MSYSVYITTVVRAWTLDWICRLLELIVDNVPLVVVDEL